MCSESGWVVRPNTNSDWTDYTGCTMVRQLRFLRLATFSWMLAEGVYLFRLLQSDSPEGESLTIYKVLCWGVPAVIAVIYGVLRETLDNTGCWVSPSENRYIEATIIIPCILALSKKPAKFWITVNEMFIGYVNSSLRPLSRDQYELLSL
ncbi:hypothetical protein Aduo_007648 [Ancylostoma duodenale]